MNVSSHPKHENRQKNVMREGSPPQGLSEARRGKFGFRENWELKPPRERPRGGGGIYRNWGYGGISPHHYFWSIFMGNHEKLLDAPGASPGRWGAPVAIVLYNL
jgi:hypothetical protein